MGVLDSCLMCSSAQSGGRQGAPPVKDEGQHPDRFQGDCPEIL
jgi:hypothetical protein